jgi:hypothetical protein
MGELSVNSIPYSTKKNLFLFHIFHLNSTQPPTLILLIKEITPLGQLLNSCSQAMMKMIFN